jgi:hypothetical protein
MALEFMPKYPEGPVSSRIEVAAFAKEVRD